MLTCQSVTCSSVPTFLVFTCLVCVYLYADRLMLVEPTAEYFSQSAIGGSTGGHNRFTIQPRSVFCLFPAKC